jgi:hypothetical protein
MGRPPPATPRCRSRALPTSRPWPPASDLYGQLGDGTQTHKNKPVYVRTYLGGIQSGIQTVATGGWHSLMVKQ